MQRGDFCLFRFDQVVESVESVGNGVLLVFLFRKCDADVEDFALRDFWLAGRCLPSVQAQTCEQVKQESYMQGREPFLDVERVIRYPSIRWRRMYGTALFTDATNNNRRLAEKEAVAPSSHPVAAINRMTKGTFARRAEIGGNV